MSKWTSTEIEFVRNHYGKLSTQVIAEQVQRKPGEVRSAAHRQGLCNSELCKRWTKEEEDILSQCVQRGDDFTWVAHQLGRSERSVYRKARLLGLTNPTRLVRRPWTESEDSVLVEMAGAYSLDEILTKLRSLSRQEGKAERTKYSVLARFATLGLSARVVSDSQYYTVSSLCTYCLRCNSSIVYGWLKDKDFQKILKPNKVGDGEKVGYYLIHHKNLRKFFLGYPSELERVKRQIDMVWLIGLLEDKS